MPATLAAYVFVPPPVIHHQTEYVPSGQPWHPPTRQDYIGFGILLAITMAAIVFINILDKGSR